MNPIAIAIQRALPQARDRASLQSAFDRELSAIEFSPDAESVIIGVPRAAALAWAMDEISDLDLILSINGECGAIFFATLPNRRHYRGAMIAAMELFNRGASLMVAQTSNRVLASHAKKCGFREMSSDGKFCRVAAERHDLSRWVSRVTHRSRRTPGQSHVTSVTDQAP
jgi:hypothetical protein